MGDHTPVPLTRSEYLICEYVVRNKGQVFSKEQIYEAVFGLECDSDNSTISTQIKIFSLILVGSSMGFLTYADYSECRAKNLVPVIAATPALTNV